MQCTECRGEKRTEVVLGYAHDPNAPVRWEECSRCEGNGCEPCDECGADADTVVGDRPLCAKCIQADYDAAAEDARWRMDRLHRVYSELQAVTIEHERFCLCRLCCAQSEVLATYMDIQRPGRNQRIPWEVAP